MLHNVKHCPVLSRTIGWPFGHPHATVDGWHVARTIIKNQRSGPLFHAGENPLYGTKEPVARGADHGKAVRKNGYENIPLYEPYRRFEGGALLSCSASGGAAVLVLWVPATMPRSNAPEAGGSSHFARIHLRRREHGTRRRARLVTGEFRG